MNSSTLSEIVDLLCSPKLRVRTGLWLMPPGLVGQETHEAARLGLDAADARQPILESVKEGQRFLGLNDSRVLEAVDAISRETSKSDCLLIYNLDLLVAGIGITARTRLWNQLYDSLPHRPRALLISMPQGATALLPKEDQLETWRREGRLVDL